MVDPGRDRVTEYLRLARKKGLRLAHVIETHTHADHISGARDLAATTKAAIHVHGSAGVAFERQDVDRDGDSIRVGNVEVHVAHTPGHTPDSICLFVTDHARSPEPWFVLTGDLLFVGSVGRPDLGGATAAEDIWSSLTRVLLPLDDSVEIYPAHGAGSSCGKAMSAKSGSTIGFERRFNPAFRYDDKQRVRRFHHGRHSGQAGRVRQDRGEEPGPGAAGGGQAAAVRRARGVGGDRARRLRGRPA